MEPDNLTALMSKAALLNRLERWREAPETAEKARRIEPSHLDVLVVSRPS